MDCRCQRSGQSESFRQQQQPSSQLAMVSLSTAQQLQLSVDQGHGLPPPAVQTIQLSTTEQAVIQSCTNNYNSEENNKIGHFGYHFAGSYHRHAIPKKMETIGYHHRDDTE
jgi:hypothetical protein